MRQLGSSGSQLARAQTLADLAVNVGGNSKGFRDDIIDVEYRVVRASTAMVRAGRAAEKAGEEGEESFVLWGKSADNATARILKLNMTLGILGRLGRMLVGAVNEAESLRTATLRLDRTFGTMAGDLAADMAKMSEAFAIPRAELLDLAATAGRAFQGLGISQARAAEMTRSIVGRAIDIGAEGSMSPAEAMQALVDAVKGGGGALARLGAEMTEAEVHARAMELGFVRAGHRMTDAERAIVRFDVAMKGTAMMEGTAEMRVDGFTAATSRLDAEFWKLASTIGDALGPGFTQYANWITRAMQQTEGFVGTVRTLIDAYAALGLSLELGTFNPREIFGVMQEQRQILKDQDAARQKQVQAGADKANDARNAKLKADQELYLFRHGARREGLDEFAKNLAVAGFKQKGIGEKQLEEQKKANELLRQLNGNVKKAAPNNGLAPGAGN